MADWHPIRLAAPVEWELRHPMSVDPIGIIRRLHFGDSRKPEIVYRAVTWHPESAKRELVGYAPTPEPLAELLWRRYVDGDQRRRDAHKAPVASWGTTAAQ